MDGEQKLQKAYESLLSNDFAKAAEWFEEAIEEDPNNAALHYKLSITYSRNNKLQKATQYARNALSFDPDNELYLAHLQHLEALQYTREAKGYYDGTDESLYVVIYLLRNATRLDPLALESFLLLSEAYGGVEDYYQAMLAAKDALRLDPEQEMAQDLLYKYKRKLNEQLRKS